MSSILTSYYRRSIKRRTANVKLEPFALYSFYIKKPEEDYENIPTLFIFVPMPGRNEKRGLYGMNLNAIVDKKLRRALAHEYLRAMEIEEDKERQRKLYTLFAQVYQTRYNTKTAYKYYPWTRISSGVFTRLPESTLVSLTR